MLTVGEKDDFMDNLMSIKLEKNLTLFYPQELNFIDIFIPFPPFIKMITCIIFTIV